jgi:hypothetical protein
MAFIRINRKLFDHNFWQENRVFSRAEAWIDLIQLVSFTSDNKKMIDGTIVKWGRGQYPVSYLFLSKRWNWSIHKVRIFINLLKSEKQVTTTTAWKATILTLCKYDIYNPNSQADVQAEAQADGTQTAGSIRIKEDKEDKLKEINKENFSILKSEEIGKAFNEINFADAPKNEEDLSFLDEHKEKNPFE